MNNLQSLESLQSLSVRELKSLLLEELDNVRKA
jgi:hypothetical protein